MLLRWTRMGNNRLAHIGQTGVHETLRPILSRLPLESLDGAEIDDSDKSLEYIDGGRAMYTQSRLPELDATSRELWNALHSFRATSLGYATLPRVHAPHPIAGSQTVASCPRFGSISPDLLRHLTDSFNWAKLPALALETERTWYGVCFHSVRKRGSATQDLYEADRLAHEEAVRSGGLIAYWYGVPHPVTGYNLATCIWTSQLEAIRASRLPQHAVAAKYASPSYERYSLMRYALVKRKGDAQLYLTPWHA